MGIGACLLVFHYVRYELSFDTHHENRDRIYRLTSYSGFGEKEWDAWFSGDPVPSMRSDYTEVEDAVRMTNCGPDRIMLDGQVFRDIEMDCTESNLFNIFSFDLAAGDASTVLDNPETAVITRSLAERLFGGEDVVGRSLPIRFDDSERAFTITGLMEDVPPNSHLTFDLLLSYPSLRSTDRCLNCGMMGYALIKPGANLSAVEDRILKHIREVDHQEHEEDIALQPLSEIYFSELHAERKGDIRYVYILSAIAILILLIACANYINALYVSEERAAKVFGIAAGLSILVACLGLFGLAAFSAQQRTKEIGIRKVLGATVRSIVTLLFKDVAILLAVAFVLAVPVSYLAGSRWLEQFAFRVEVGPWLFVAAGAVVFVVALLSTGYQSARAALRNPAESLRYE